MTTEDVTMTCCGENKQPPIPDLGEEANSPELAEFSDKAHGRRIPRRPRQAGPSLSTRTQYLQNQA